jgi:hypothetical protein
VKKKWLAGKGVADGAHHHLLSGNKKEEEEKNGQLYLFKWHCHRQTQRLERRKAELQSQAAACQGLGPSRPKMKKQNCLNFWPR